MINFNIKKSGDFNLILNDKQKLRSGQNQKVALLSQNALDALSKTLEQKKAYALRFEILTQILNTIPAADHIKCKPYVNYLLNIPECVEKIATIIKAIHETAEEERAIFIVRLTKALSTFLGSLSTVDDLDDADAAESINDIIEVYAQIPTVGETFLDDPIGYCLSKCDNSFHISTFLKLCRNTPQQVQFIDLIGRCIAQEEVFLDFESIIPACLEIPPNDRKNFAIFITPYLEYLSESLSSIEGAFSTFLNICVKIPIADREAFSSYIDPFEGPWLYEIIVACAGLPIASLKRITAFMAPIIVPIIKDTDPENDAIVERYETLISAAFIAYRQILQEENALFIELIPALISDRNFLNEIVGTLQILSLFPPIALPSIQLYLREILNITDTRHRLLLLNALVFKHPADWSDFIANTTSQLPQDLEARKIRTRNYLYGLLETTTKEHRAREYARFIINNRHPLGLAIEFSDMLYMAEYILQISSDLLRNPYAIHAKLEQFWNNPLLEFQPPSQSIAGMDVSLNLVSFREQRIEPVKKDIDLRIHPDLFGGLLKALDNRIKNLPSYEEKKKAKDAIQKITDVELHHLMHQFPTLHLIQLLDRIYALPTGAPLSQPEQQLIQLLTYLLNRKTILENNTSLTEQETLLLHIARAIANCDAGQNRALAALVRGIEKNAFRDIQLSATEDEAATLQLIHEVVQKQKESANDVFDAENELMLNLAGPNGVKQLVHQAPYVRNMLAPILGLDHTLYFDLHAEVISQNLLKMSREELLNIFFQYPHFTPEAFVMALQNELCRPITGEDHTWIRGATELLTKFGHSTVGCFDMEEDRFILTEKGAILLLQAAGYVYTNNLKKLKTDF